MYFQPYGDDQQLNLNWIINEIINLHKQLDPNYETPSFTQVYPYSNLNRLNLDWILSELKALKELAPEPTPAEIDIQAVAVALVALPFDTDTSYQIYDFISRDGEIWRSTEAIPAGGVWDETKWFKTKLGTDLAVLERWINAINNSLTSLQNTVADLSSADISDDSNAGGATVKASLNNLKNNIEDLESAIGSNKYKFVAGALRKTTTGWIYIDDSGHSPINVSGAPVVETDEHFLRINFNFTASKIKTFICGCDETWSQYFNIGASVGDSYARLNIHNLPINQGGMAIYDPNNTIDAQHSNGWTLNTVYGVREIANIGQGRAQWLTEALPFDLLASVDDVGGGVAWLLSAFANSFACSPQSAGASQMTAVMKNYDGTGIQGSDYPTDASLRLFVQRTIPTMKLKWSNITANNLANIWFFGLFEVE